MRPTRSTSSSTALIPNVEGEAIPVEPGQAIFVPRTRINSRRTRVSACRDLRQSVGVNPQPNPWLRRRIALRCAQTARNDDQGTNVGHVLIITTGRPSRARSSKLPPFYRLGRRGGQVLRPDDVGGCPRVARLDSPGERHPGARPCDRPGSAAEQLAGVVLGERGSSPPHTSLTAVLPPLAAGGLVSS